VVLAWGLSPVSLHQIGHLELRHFLLGHCCSCARECIDSWREQICLVDDVLRLRGRLCSWPLVRLGPLLVEGIAVCKVNIYRERLRLLQSGSRPMAGHILPLVRHPLLHEDASLPLALLNNFRGLLSFTQHHEVTLAANMEVLLGLRDLNGFGSALLGLIEGIAVGWSVHHKGRL